MKSVSVSGVVSISPFGIVSVDDKLVLADAVKKICEAMEIDGFHSFAGRVTLTVEDLSEEMTVR